MKTALSTLSRNCRPWLSARHSVVAGLVSREDIASNSFVAQHLARPRATIIDTPRYNSSSSHQSGPPRTSSHEGQRQAYNPSGAGQHAAGADALPAHPDEYFPSLQQDDEAPVRPLTDRKQGLYDYKGLKEMSDRQISEQQYRLFFTCAKCLERSSHRISKQGYHHGTVLVNCPKCKNKHLISDHLKIFSDRSITLEDIMKEKGEKLQRGVLGADGDVEFF